uniref:Uncharacterized protein n=1 Tax=Anguilla anguilla TaxID=7936 RepID=A0A0E9T5N8_ANGAN
MPTATSVADHLQPHTLFFILIKFLFCNYI